MISRYGCNWDGIIKMCAFERSVESATGKEKRSRKVKREGEKRKRFQLAQTTTGRNSKCLRETIQITLLKALFIVLNPLITLNNVIHRRTMLKINNTRRTLKTVYIVLILRYSRGTFVTNAGVLH